MWKLSGSPVCSAAAHRRSQAGSPASKSKTSMIAPRWPMAGNPLELGHRRLGRVAGQEREGAEPIGSEGVELLDGPVVPGRVAGRLQVRLGDGEGQRDGTVDDRGPHPVEVHVLQPQLRDR